MEYRFKRIYIEITNICNLNCKFCSKSKRKQEEMTANSFEKVLKKIKGYSKYIYLHVKGEPLTHTQFGEILDLIKKHEFEVIITTNGLLLEKQKEILKQSKCIRQINVSVHSFNQNENKNQLKKVYIENIIKIINEIAEKTNSYVSYRLWDMKDVEDVYEIREELKLIGKKYNFENILEIAKKQSFIELGNKKYINLDKEYVWPSLENDVISNIGNCYGLINQIAILVDGTVIPCCLDQDGNINLGNIFKEDLKEILEKNITKEIIKGFKENKLVNPLCQKCGFREEKRK